MPDIKKATERQARYDRNNTFRLPLKFNKKNDADIQRRFDEIRSLDKYSIQGYIKRLIRSDILRQKESGMNTQEYFDMSQKEYDEASSADK